MQKGWLSVMNLLIDMNVILNMVFKRSGFDDAVQLFRKIKESNNNAFITASTVTDLFYIIRKEMHDTDKTYVVMENIFKLVGILAVTEEDIQLAFEQKWKDFEDCVQYTTAKNNRMDYIVTGNRKDYEDSSVAVVLPKECIELL